MCWIVVLPEWLMIPIRKYASDRSHGFGSVCLRAFKVRSIFRADVKGKRLVFAVDKVILINQNDGARPFLQHQLIAVDSPATGHRPTFRTPFSIGAKSAWVI